MKAEIKISVNGNQCKCEGNIIGCRKTQAFELVCTLAEILGINSSEDWAALTIYNVLRDKNQGHLEKTEIKIPNINKKEKDHD